jgi:hypothetical protein
MGFLVSSSSMRNLKGGYFVPGCDRCDPLSRWLPRVALLAAILCQRPGRK